MNQETQDRLTRIGPGTSMGALLRRYWMPLLPSVDLQAGTARAVRILGENLAAFRTRDGQLGLLEERCPHRGCSLAQGCVEREGIRCPYHGWKFDTEGVCLELPAEPDNSPLLGRVRASAYRAAELGGLVFAYLGPEPAPLLPRFDLFVWGNVLRDIGVAELPCNWLQIMENSVDPYHVEWLHGHFFNRVAAQHGQATAPAYQKKHLKVGFDLFEYGIIKRRVVEGHTEADDDWRIGHPLIFPIMVRVGSRGQHVFQIRVPIDDEHTRHFWYTCWRPAKATEVPVQDVVPSYEVPWRDEQGAFIVDTIPGQDIMTWVTQGPIADRTREQLGGSDRGIALFRKLLLKQLEAMHKGKDPIGTVRDSEHNRIIELPQEQDRFGGGAAFLGDLLAVGHTRYSPILNEIKALFEDQAT
ncbi:MAG: aromatic ring-hydroxylating dioxygenase subunit alpha [Pseudomonadota bacterium]